MSEESAPQARRRGVLAGFASAGTALTGGCLRRIRSLTGWESARQVALRIKTLPADADPYALGLARTVAGWFRAAGIDTGVVPMTEEELLRETLLRQEFELFVVRLPARFRDPDALHTLVHSRGTGLPGWQNPFGYANFEVDELLERQRRTSGRRRREALSRIQVLLAKTQPFTMLTVPDDIRAVREDEYTRWRRVDLRSPLGYLMLDRQANPQSGEDTTLRITRTDGRATRNLNPLSIEFRGDGVVTGLLYDPLGYPYVGDMMPWLAASWEFVETTPPVARVHLREGSTWHDGEPLTADDVAFTYALLADTTLGADGDEEATPLPSPRFSGRSSLVDDARAIDDGTVEVTFGDVDPSVTTRAFTVPILPEHVWEDRADMADIGGFEFGPVTEALVTNNIPPVGSGPLEFVRNSPREEVVLERFDDHFLNRDVGNGLPERIGPAPFDRFEVRVVRSETTGVELVSNGDADVTDSPVGAGTVPRIGRSAELALLVDQSDAPYVLGYNVRRPHLNNPRFRNTLARLVDGNYLSEDVLGGYGRPAVGPLWGTRWYPEELAWSDGNPVTPFYGTGGDLDEERARAAFREMGYRYDDGRLVGGDT